MMNLWVAAHALFKGCPPQDLDNHAPSDNEAVGPSVIRRLESSLGQNYETKAKLQTDIKRAIE